ncbi:Uncharacterized protein Rs2_09975 [Raphanus sativus]|nr:Uncharacterized protein Rs2_09975 [Raphanus sativus]
MEEESGSGRGEHDEKESHEEEEADDEEDERTRSQGVIIEEINEEEADHVVPDEDAYERNSPEMEAEADVDELWNGEAMPNMYTNDLIMDEIRVNPADLLRQRGNALVLVSTTTMKMLEFMK